MGKRNRKWFYSGKRPAFASFAARKGIRLKNVPTENVPIATKTDTIPTIVRS
jgi:hypothetical protein